MRALGGIARSLPCLAALGATLTACSPTSPSDLDLDGVWAVRIPAAAIDPAPAGGGVQTAVLAGGCFWGVEAVFEHVQGVQSVVSGYAGGAAAAANYTAVSTGATGHAESVQIRFDPARISFGKILQVFFSVAHDPTQLDSQFPDDGPQYRSEIFFSDAAQQQVARTYITQLTDARSLPRPIVTRVEPLPAFYPAEEEHQDFAARNPDEPYIVRFDRPKVDSLKTIFPELYRPS